MISEFDVLVSADTGIPYVKIAAHELWSLAEYLSLRREKATFSYDSNQFTVAFVHCDRYAAQSLLHDWRAFSTTESVPEQQFAHPFG